MSHRDSDDMPLGAQQPECHGTAVSYAKEHNRQVCACRRSETIFSCYKTVTKFNFRSEFFSVVLQGPVNVYPAGRPAVFASTEVRIVCEMFGLIREVAMLSSGPDDLPTGAGEFGGAAVLVSSCSFVA
jgi:hypothetical protein